jgi:Beta-lactamase
VDETQLYTDLQACVGDSTCWKGINHYSYSNFGYGVLGNVLADHDGPEKWSLDNFYNVMAPLGMVDTKTSEDYDSADFLHRRAYGHIRSSAGDWTVSRTTSQSFGVAPAGGLWSTPTDMLIWLGNATGVLQGNHGVDAALRMTMECRGPWGKNSTCSSVQDCGSCTGLAWTEDIDPCTVGIRISKSGAVPGFKSWIGFVKGPGRGTGRGVFVLLNSGAINGDTIGEKLLDMIP